MLDVSSSETSNPTLPGLDGLSPGVPPPLRPSSSPSEADISGPACMLLEGQPFPGKDPLLLGQGASLPISPSLPPPPPPPPTQSVHQPLRPRPSTATLSRLLKKPSLIGPFLRGMQSFDSGRTERQSSSAAAVAVAGPEGSGSPPETPPRADPVPGLLASDVAAAGELRAAAEGTALWAWLASPATEDDPRFVLWRTAGGSGGRSPSTPTFSPAPIPLGGGSSDASATAAAAVIIGRQLLAASLNRWIHQLTSALDSDGAFDFLLVYRRFCPPATLLALLTSRFEWACGLDCPPAAAAAAIDDDDESAGPSCSQQRPASDAAFVLARTRTMRVLAFWLSTFFEEDWLPSVALRRQLTNWLNGLRHRPELDGVLGARSLLKRLKAVVKDRKRAFDTPAGQAVYESRAAPASATSFSSAEPDDINGGRGPEYSPATGTRRTASSPAADPPLLFPTRHKTLLVFSPPGSPPAPLPKHGMSKLWGSIGRAATRSRLSTGPPKIVSGALAGASTSFDDLFHPSTGGPLVVDSLSGDKRGLEAYLLATHVSRLGSTAPSPTSMSDPESRSSHSSSTAATSTSGSDEAELEPPMTMATRQPVPTSPLEKVEEERSSSELPPSERRSGFAEMRSRLAVDSASYLSPEREMASAEPSPVDSTFSAATSFRLDVRSLALSCSSDDADFRVPRRPMTSVSSLQPTSVAVGGAKPAWTPIVPFATIAFDDVSLSDSDDDGSWQSHLSTSLDDDATSASDRPRRHQQLNLRRQSIDALGNGGVHPYLVPQPGSTDSFVTSPTTGRHRIPRPGSADSSASSDQGAWRNSLLARFDLEALESDAASDISDDGGVEAALRRLNGDYDVEKRRAREARIERLVAANRDAWRRHEPLPVHRRPASIDFHLIEPGTTLDCGLAPALGLPLLASPLSPPSLAEGKFDLATPAEEISAVCDTVRPSADAASRRVSAPAPYRPAFSPSSSGPSSFIFGRKRSSTHESLASLTQPGPASPHKPLALAPAAATSPIKAGRRLSFTLRSRPGSASPVASAAQAASAAMSRALFPGTQPVLRHQSFILAFKTSVLAAQFSIIDAQLLNAVGFEELARKPAPWVANPLPALDSWEDLWREKARWKVERNGRPSDVSMIVRRFELVVRWVETELVLAARAGRSSLIILVERFVKLAAALFQLSNLQSCVAIVYGLQTPVIDRLMQAHKAWTRLSLWERRVFKDLRLITSAEGSWANVRKAHVSILDKHAGRLFEDVLYGSTAAVSTASPGPPESATAQSLTGATREDAFLPFMGTYLHDLRQLDIYPDFVAPRLSDAERDHLPALPPCLQLGGPLINVDKAKQHARIIREVCLFKTLAVKFGTVPAETAPFQLCFKLRAAPPDAIAGLAQLACPC